MPGIYARWIDRWETELAQRDSNRVVRPFEWGLDWLGLEPGGDPRRQLREYAARAVANSAAFFAYQRPADYRLRDRHLTFTSPVESPYPENNLVHADYFPARRDRGRSVVVLPQWNADAQGHAGLCRLLNRFGLTALRLSLAYHDRRMPAGLERADYHVSSNIGRTLHATRQSIIDARACLDWLEMQGHSQLAILGTSLGSAIASIAAAHEPRLRAGVFNHVSTFFADVVWTGLSTQHVRQGFGSEVTQDELREYWRPISPATHLERLAGRGFRSLLIWARHDTSFLPVYSRQCLERFRQLGLWRRTLALPCAHYTTGEFPFVLLDGLAMCWFLARNLPRS
ncbi:MAG: alpha/beta hydrolase family protein [Acidobacteriota bacterium]